MAVNTLTKPKDEWVDVSPEDEWVDVQADSEWVDVKPDTASSFASKAIDALKFETKRQLAPISGVVDKFKNLTTPEIPDANDPRRQMLGQAIKSALPALTDPNAPEALKELVAAGAYEVAGAVKGATLGYVDPVPLLEKTPLAKADISKPIAVGAGQFVGALAPISVISRGIGLTLKASGLLNGVRPVLQGLVHSGVTGAIFGASSKTENSEESQITQRAHQALNDAAGFIVFTGAAQLVDKAAKALSSGNKANFNDYQVFRKSVIDTFVSKGANPEDAARMADVGIDAAVKSGGGWGDVTKGDLLKAQEAIKKGQKIIIEQPISGAGEPNVSTTQMPVKTPRTQPAPASSLKDLSKQAQNVVSTRFPILGKALAEKPIPMAPGELQATLTRGVAAGEEVLLRGGTPEEANIAALKSFAQDVKPIIEKNVPQQKFMGRLEPGEMYGDKVITGNFNRKMDAIAHAEQTGGKVEGYLSGKFKRGWVVKNVPRETNLGRGLTENPTSEQAGVSTLKPLPPFETKPPEKAMEAPIQQYKATEVGKDIESRAFETFGETKVLRDAGFVMPSGKMVDFTKGTGNRLYSHYDAARELTGKEDNLYDMIDQMKAVRVVHYSDLNGENISFQARGPLSTDQLNAVRDYYAENKVSHSNLEIVDGSGHQVRAKSIDKPTIEDISQFFNGTSLMEKPAISRYDFNTGKMVEVKKPGQKEDMGVNSPYEEKLPQEQGKTSPEVSPMRESFKAIQGARFETEFRETGAVVVPNKKLNTPADAAYVFRQFRNPVQEGFSLIALKNGRVVGVEYIGFGTIDQVATYPFNTLHILDKTQADSVYISHNHPSGEVIPSEEDKRLTRMMKDVFDNHDVKFNGHVIINDTKFGFIDGNGNVSEGVHQEYAQTKTVPVLQKFYKWKEGMDKPGPYLTSPKSVFELHKGIQKDPNEGVLFLLDTQNRIINTVIVPKDQITPKVLQRIVSLYRPAGIVSASSGIDSRQVRAAKEAMRNLDVRYHDDILVDGDQYQSKLESGLMEPRAQYGAKKWGGKVWETEISPFTDEPGTEGMRYKPGTLERTPNIKVNSLDITPSMKESVLFEGQPQYKAVDKRLYGNQEPGEPKKRINEMIRPKEPKLYTERQALRISLGKQREAAMTSRMETKAELTDLKREIVTSVESALPTYERGQFLPMIANASTQLDLVKALSRIDQAVERSQKKILINSIKTEVKRINKFQTFAIDYRFKVNMLMDDFLTQKPRESTLKRYTELKKYIDSQARAGKDVKVPQYILDNMRVLTAKPLSDLTSAELQDLLSRVRILGDIGKMKLRTRKELDGLMKEKDMVELSEGTKKLGGLQKSIPEPGETLSAVQDMQNTVKNLANAYQDNGLVLMPSDPFFDYLDGGQNYSGPNFRIFKARVDMGFSQYLQDKHKISTDFSPLVKGMTEENSNRIGIYAHLQQEGGIEKLYNRYGIESEPKTTEAVKAKEEFDKKIQAIKLTPQEMKAYKFMREEMDKTLPEVSDVMKEVHNEEVGQVKNYFPFMTDYAVEPDISVSERIKMDFAVRKKNVEMGFTKERTGPGGQVTKTDAFETYLKHMDDVAYLINMGRTTKYLGELARSKEYGDLAGDVGQKMVLDWIDTIARKGGAMGGQQIGWMDKLRVNMGAATLGFKLSSMMIQFGPIGEAAGWIGNDAFKGTWDYVNHPEWRSFVNENMPEVRERAGDDPALTEYIKGSNLRKINEFGYWGIKTLDGFSAASVATGAYQKYMREHGLEIDFNNPNQEALNYAQFIVRRSQGSAFFKDVPQTISRGKLFGSENKSVVRAIWQFQNFVINQYSVMRHDMLREGIFKGNFKKAGMLATWLVLTAIATTGMRMGIRKLKDKITGYEPKKPKTLSEQMIKGTINELVTRVPFLSQAMSMLTYGSLPVPALDFLYKGATAAKQFVGKTPETRMRGKIGLAGAAGRMLGVPGTGEIESIAKKLVPQKKSLSIKRPRLALR